MKFYDHRRVKLVVSQTVEESTWNYDFTLKVLWVVPYLRMKSSGYASKDEAWTAAAALIENLTKKEASK